MGGRVTHETVNAPGGERPALLAASRTSLLAAAGVSAAAIAVSAWLSIPFIPVPLTLQTLAVLVVGGILGPVWGPAAVLVYLGLGALGLPVFHGGTGGLGVLAGPTGGYLVGFVPAAFVVGLASRAAWRHGRLRTGGTLLLAVGAVAATAVIYLVGVPWLALVANLTADKAVASGLLPFLLGDLLKAVAAVLVTRAVVRALAATGTLSRLTT